jgi:hypothetical protein
MKRRRRSDQKAEPAAAGRSDGSSGKQQQGAGLRSRAPSNRRGKEPNGEGEQHEAAQGTDC